MRACWGGRVPTRIGAGQGGSELGAGWESMRPPRVEGMDMVSWPREWEGRCLSGLCK